MTARGGTVAKNPSQNNPARKKRKKAPPRRSPALVIAAVVALAAMAATAAVAPRKLRRFISMVVPFLHSMMWLYYEWKTQNSQALRS